MKKVRLGLIGAGEIARKHLEVIKAIDWIEAVGITSRTRSKALALADEYGMTVCADDVDGLVREAKPDGLMVLVSIDQTYKVVSEAVRYNLPLFIEKPAGLTPEENKNLADLAQKNSISSMVGFNRRFYSVFRKGIEIIKNSGPLLGVLVEGHERMWLRADKLEENIRSKWVFANSVHTIDLIRFFGGEVRDIKSIAHRYVEKNGDQFASVMELESGAIGHYISHWYSPGGWRVVLYGDGVTVEFKPLEQGSWMDRDFKIHEILPDECDTRFKAGFFMQMEAFGNLILSGKKEWPVQDLNGAYRTMSLTQQVAQLEGKKKHGI